ncbi:cytochrome c oxidase assembly protein [Fodinicola acaciae]|uniref:cytochrome c oxidase assembly protein n=1 Tax=Fodinicola acaciae TaxID=2681555 RepID=UPI0013D50742|nr:cytochrome c oxidase assembly protein [Fodinicola acaciae]
MSTPARTDSPVHVPTVLAAALLAAVAVAAIALWTGGAVTNQVPGLPDPGPLTIWALPLSTVLGQLAAATTVGGLAVAAFAIPTQHADNGRRVSAHGYLMLRTASVAAIVWALATAAQLCFTLSDLLGQPVTQALNRTSLVSFVSTVEVGQTLTVMMVAALLIATASRIVLSATGAAVLAVLSVAAAMPPVFSGHAASAGNHQMAVSTMILHVGGVLVWTGGLIALLLCRRLPTPALSAAAHRYSKAALAAFVVVGLSGVVNATVRVQSWGALFGTGYGRIVILKFLALVSLGVFGWWHRKRTLPALADGARGAFVRLAAVEVLVFAATVGLAVALSRTPPAGVPEELDRTGALLGFPMPGPATLEKMVFNWLPEPLFIAVSLAAIGFYLAGVWRLRKRGDRWPVSRTACWVAGWLIVIVVTSSGLARYGYVLFSIHMIQHMTLAMLAPAIMVLGGPMTLALRALPPSTDKDLRGPREWLLWATGTPVAKLLTNPLVALTLYVASFYAMYFTGLYEQMLRSHALHLLMFTHFLAAGYLFFWILIGVDPAPRPLPYPVRIPLLFVSMIFHAFFGLALMQTATLLAAGWYESLVRTWGATPLADQQVGAGIAWAFGELPSLVIALALLYQWIRSDEREQRRLDRAADRAEARAAARGDAEPAEDDQDALAAYNRRLKALAEADDRTRQRH